MTDVSLIICTCNRAPQLASCLAEVAKADFSSRSDIVIVDNGSTDRTAEVVASFARNAPVEVTYVREDRPGLSNARNAGLRRSRGQIIAFSDDDCYIAPDFITQTVRIFAEHGVGYATGRVLLHDPSDARVTINESTTPISFAPFTYIPAGAVKGANMAFRRELLEALGGFDPLFGSGSLFPAEDCDAAGRASLLGWAGRYSPEIVVSHHHGRKLRDVGSLLKAYDIGRGAYHMKLLVTERAYRASLRGWRGFPRRVAHRPATAWWELVGATGYLLATLPGKRGRA